LPANRCETGGMHKSETALLVPLAD
jgi:hypothetical protein